MKLHITRRDVEHAAERSGSSEWIGENECVIDLYDIPKPATFDIVMKKDLVFSDGAFYMEYDEDEGGWYVSEEITDRLEIERILLGPGAPEA